MDAVAVLKCLWLLALELTLQSFQPLRAFTLSIYSNM